MSDLIDLDNLTLNDIRRLRKALFERLLFEPVTDPDFERPAEKLRGLVRESTRLSDRLRTVVHRYDQYLEVLDKAQQNFQRAHDYMETVRSFGTQLPSFEQTIYDAVKSAMMTPEEREQTWQKEAPVKALQHDALNLSLAYMNLNGTMMLLRLTLRTSQLTTAQLGVFLEKATEAVTKGTSESFHQHTLPAKPDELISDAVDRAVEKAELPSVTPVLHVIEFIFKYIRRKEIREEKIAETWTSFEMNIFLAGFFNWWTEAGGGAAMEKVIADCEEALRIHEQTTQAFGVQAGDFGRALADFQERVNRSGICS